MSDLGRLHGEIALGYYRIRRDDRGHRGLPAEHSSRRSLHIILSHHGSLEHGSPVVPCTREATLVHMVDNLGGRLGSFDRVEKELLAAGAVVGFDKAIGAGGLSSPTAGRRAREGEPPSRASRLRRPGRGLSARVPAGPGSRAKLPANARGCRHAACLRREPGDRSAAPPL